MTTIIDTLIYDRTQEDVDRVYYLQSKFYEGTWTEADRLEYMAGMKGAYNYTDMNRVGEVVAYIAERMTTLPDELETYREEREVADDPIYRVPYDPESIVVTAKTDWELFEPVTQAGANAYLEDLQVLCTAVTLPANAPEVPTTLNYLTYEVANNIEYLLYLTYQALLLLEEELYRKIDLTVEGFVYAGMTYCGE